MSGALERAARALYEFGMMADCQTWDQLEKKYKEDFFDMVRAVLMAVREPDDAMLTEGFYSLPGVGDPEREDANAIWTAMIDAILGEGEGE